MSTLLVLWSGFLTMTECSRSRIRPRPRIIIFSKGAMLLIKQATCCITKLKVEVLLSIQHLSVWGKFFDGQIFHNVTWSFFLAYTSYCLNSSCVVSPCNYSFINYWQFHMTPIGYNDDLNRQFPSKWVITAFQFCEIFIYLTSKNKTTKYQKIPS